MKNRKRFNSIILVLSLVLVGLFGYYFYIKNLEDKKTQQQAKARAEELNHEEKNNIISYNGKEYVEDDSIINYLFIGVDDRQEFSDIEDTPGDAANADCLILLSMNTNTHEATLLQINRNAMTELDVYDNMGYVRKSIDGQICLQFAYSSGGRRGCYAQTKTVSEMLFQTKIDGYFCMTLSGINEINDSLGGVTVKMNQDYTWIDPSFVEGEEVRLEGDLAQKFVQFRDTEAFNSVQNRMERQIDYVVGLLEELRAMGGNEMVKRLSKYFGSYILTDMDSEELSNLIEYEFTLDRVEYLPGEMVMGEKYEEFYIDNAALIEQVIDKYYKEYQA